MKGTLYFLLVALAACGARAGSQGHPAWGYGKTIAKVLSPADWVKEYPFCGKKAQSPINIKTVAVKSNSLLEDLHLSFTKVTEPATRVVGTLTNNGHAPTLIINRSKGTARVTGGPLNDEIFELLQFHFHFGCNSAEGSEHTVDGKSASGELHLVFYNTKYDASKAASKPNGLAVIGVLLKQEKQTASKTLQKLIKEKMTKVVDEGSSVKVTAVDGITIKGILPDSAYKGFSYWTYKGSLTTPPCYQSVRWIVMKNKFHSICKRHLNILKKLKAEHGITHGQMCNNFRPTQPLNGRKIETPCED